MKKILLSLAALTPMPVLAHTDHAAPHWFTGLLHPLTGLDHLLALLAVGACLGCLRSQRTAWQALAAIMAVMALAMAAAFTLAATINLELMLLLTVCLSGALLFGLRAQPSALVAVVLAMVLGIHGWVHGNELPAGRPMGFALELWLASTAIAAGSLLLAHQLNQRGKRAWLRTAGAAVACAGLVLSFV